MHRIALVHSLFRTLFHRSPLCICGEHHPCVRSGNRPPRTIRNVDLTYGGWK